MIKCNICDSALKSWERKTCRKCFNKYYIGTQEENSESKFVAAVRAKRRKMICQVCGS
jgi:hypothetical protein